jgi:hypothetical protein
VGAAAPTGGAGPAAGQGLTLRLLGGCEVLVDGVAVNNWPRQIAKAVLAALALYPRGLSMVELSEHVSEGEAVNLTRFKVAVSTLRKALEPDVANARDTRFVVTEGDRYKLNPDHLALVDVRAFETGLQLAERLRAEDPAAAAARLSEALALYCGDLLDVPGLRDHFEAEREALKAKAREGFLRLAQLQAGSPAAAAATASTASSFFRPLILRAEAVPAVDAPRVFSAALSSFSSYRWQHSKPSAPPSGMKVGQRASAAKASRQRSARKSNASAIGSGAPSR